MGVEIDGIEVAKVCGLPGMIGLAGRCFIGMLGGCFKRGIAFAETFAEVVSAAANGEAQDKCIMNDTSKAKFRDGAALACAAPAVGPGRQPLCGEPAARRTRRVLILMLGIIALSVVDLMITLTHLRSVGMIEANPVAAYLIQTFRSSWLLAAYKLATLSVCIVILYYVRRHVLGEVGAWVSMSILAGMCVIWHTYSQQLDDPTHMELVQLATQDERWLLLE